VGQVHAVQYLVHYNGRPNTALCHTDNLWSTQINNGEPGI